MVHSLLGVPVQAIGYCGKAVLKFLWGGMVNWIVDGVNREKC